MIRQSHPWLQIEFKNSPGFSPSKAYIIIYIKLQERAGGGGGDDNWSGLAP